MYGVDDHFYVAESFFGYSLGSSQLIDRGPVEFSLSRTSQRWARDEGGVVGEKGFGEFVMRGASRMAGT